MSHTPGPWIYKVRRDGSIIMSRGDPLKGPHHQSDIYGSEADVRLMAAALDLLTVLQVISADSRWTSGEPLLLQVRAAIAKAKGEA